MKSLLFINLVLLVQWCRCEAGLFLEFAHSFTLSGNQLPSLLSGNLSRLTSGIGQHGQLSKLVRRQETCVDPGYVPCPNIADKCCPAGDSCFPTGCCPTGDELCGSDNCFDPQTEKCCSSGYSCLINQDCVSGGCCPTGEVPCGTTKCYDPKTAVCCEGASGIWSCPVGDKCCSDGYCYNPDSERCCTNGSCPEEDSCCENQCCKNIAYCGSDGNCALCPPATTTFTTTEESTFLSITTSTVTETKEPEEPEEASDFTCPPMTVTNSDGATLELGTDCGLSFTPGTATPTGPSSQTSAGLAARHPRPTSPVAQPQLRPRQLPCTPYTTITEMETITSVVTSRSTETTTVFTEPEEFSCTPMSVTNANGDELSLDEDCQLEFSPASPTASATATTTTSKSAASRQESPAAPLGAAIVFLWLAVFY